MKNRRLLIFSLVALLSSACQRLGDSCPPCVNGECVDGACVCEIGHEGVSCDSLSANKFFHNGYHNNLFCQDTTTLWLSDIQAANPYPAGLLITGLAEAGDSVLATAHADGITIPEQIYGDGSIKGNGTYSSGTVSITFQTLDGMGTQRQCVAVLSR